MYKENKLQKALINENIKKTPGQYRNLYWKLCVLSCNGVPV